MCAQRKRSPSLFSILIVFALHTYRLILLVYITYAEV